MPGPALLTLGHGYAAAAFAASLPEGWAVTGTTRSAARAEAMRAAGVAPIDWADAAAVDAAIGVADYLLISVPPDAEGDPVLARHRTALASARPRWIGYLSTTGVYGDRQGGWVDEAGELLPVHPRAEWRVAAERAWLELGQPLQIFRLAGIYGPGRSVLERLRAGTAHRVVKPGQVFSRIHVADIAAVLKAGLARPDAGPVYNVADDEPAPPQDVIVFAAGLLGMPPPPEISLEDAQLTPMARSFWAESKRVSNRRIHDELGVELRYPDYRAGLRAILAAAG